MTHLSKRCYRTKRFLVLFMQVFSDVFQYLQVLSIYVAWLGYLVKPWFHYQSNKCLNLSFPFNTVIDTDFSPVCCAICLINLDASTWLSRVKVGLLWNTTNTKQMLTNILAFILGFYPFVSSGAIPSIFDHVIFMLRRLLLVAN